MMGAILAVWLMAAGVMIPANTPFLLEWEPNADTVSFRILVNDVQIGHEIPRDFTRSARFTFGPAPAGGSYLIQVLSVDAAGVVSPAVFRVNGAGPPTGLLPPGSPWFTP